MLMDDVCTIFSLKTTPEEDQVLLIKTLLSNGKMNEAVTYAWKLGLQRHFNMAEVSRVIRSTPNFPSILNTHKVLNIDDLKCWLLQTDDFRSLYMFFFADAVASPGSG